MIAHQKHTEKNRVTSIKELAQIPIVKSPHRDSGKNWKGIKHSDLIKKLWKEMDARGWVHERLVCWVSNDKCDAICTMNVIVPKLKLPPGIELDLGIYNSNAQRRSFELVIGCMEEVGPLQSAHVVLGRITTRKRHTLGTNMEKLITKALDLFEKRAKRKLVKVERFKEKEIGQADIDAIVLETARNKILPWTYTGEFDALLDKWTLAHDVPMTLWDVLTIFSMAVERCPPQKQMDIMARFTKLIEAPFK